MQKDLQDLINIAAIYRKRGMWRQANEILQAVLNMQELGEGLNVPDAAKILHELAEVYADQQRYSEARELLRRATDIWQANANGQEDILFFMSTLERLQQVSQKAAPDEDSTQAA